MDGLEVMQGYGCWCMEVCLRRKWRDTQLVGLLSKCYKMMDRTSICVTLGGGEDWREAVPTHNHPPGIF